jgi:DNA-binding NtrC family response regulator
MHPENTCLAVQPVVEPAILVADDSPSIRLTLLRLLAKQGFRIHMAQDGREAARIYARERQHIKLVLLDVCMPVLDGPATLTALQAINPQVRCCFMTGGLGRYTEEELLDRGALAILPKPLPFSELLPLLRKQMGFAEDLL